MKLKLSWKTTGIFCLFFLFGCGSNKAPYFRSHQFEDKLPLGTKIGSLEHSGINIGYRIHIPPSYQGKKPLPIVFVLQPYIKESIDMEIYTGMTELADQEGFVVVYPERGPGGWNWKPNSGSFDHVGFIKRMLEKIQSEIKLNNSQVFAVGFMDGGNMAYSLASAMPDKIAAIGVVLGETYGEQKYKQIFSIPKPIFPISMVIFQTKKDSKGYPDVFEKHFFNPIPSWVLSDGFPKNPKKIVKQNGKIIKQIWNNAQKNMEVDLYTITSGNQDWPGAKFSHFGEPVNEISATSVIWEFFKKHPKSGSPFSKP